MSNGDWKDDAEQCLERALPGVLKPHEIDFLEDIIENWEGDELTDAQQTWLDALVERVDLTAR